MQAGHTIAASFPPGISFSLLCCGPEPRSGTLGTSLRLQDYPSSGQLSSWNMAFVLIF